MSLYDDLEDDPFAPLEGYNNEHIGKLVADAKSDGSDDDSSSDSDSHGDSDSDSEGEGDGANRSKNKAKTRKSYTFAEMVKRATELEKEGQLKFAAHYYLYCLQHYRETQAEGGKSKHGADGEGENGAGSITLIGYCLNRLSSICYKNKKFKEALQFQQAERMLYESNLLAIDTVDKGSQDAADSKEGSNSNGTEEEDGGEGAGEGMFKKVGITSVDPFAVSVDQDTCPKSMAEQEAHALQYERLGRIFMKEGNVELAKSYALKAIKIRQDIKNRWGDLNNITANQVSVYICACACVCVSLSVRLCVVVVMCVRLN